LRQYLESWNDDSLTGRAYEVVENWWIEELMWHAFKKHDGKVVVASSMELKANDVSCSG